MNSKFNFFENVRVVYKGKYLTGVVVGMAEENSIWSFAVLLQNGITVCLQTDDLESLGTYTDREDVYSGTTIKVSGESQNYN